MDPALRALCQEVIAGDVNSERFAWLLIETGVSVEGYEWDVANKLIRQKDTTDFLTKKFGDTIQ